MDTCCGERYSINWSTALAPDPGMVPGIDVFPANTHHSSLPAFIQHTSTFLWTPAEELADLFIRQEQRKMARKYEQEKNR